jgi:hypothetical protein
MKTVASITPSLLLAGFLAAAACGGSDVPGVPDGAPLPDAAVPDAGPPPHSLSFWIVGDPAPLEPAIPTSQSPQAMTVALNRIELLRAIDDAEPVIASDPEIDVVVDMLGKTELTQVDLHALPEGTYTHLRLRAAHASFTVGAMAHSGDLFDEGSLTLTSALSDTVIDGVPWTKGQTLAVFQGVLVPNQEMQVEAPPYPDDYPLTVVDDGLATYIVLELDRPLVIDHSVDTFYTAELRFLIGDSFQWRDETAEGFVEGTWDISDVAGLTEKQTLWGARGATATLE